MANIYGVPQSEKEILDKCPEYIRKFEDIDKIFKESNAKLEEENKKFYDELPNRINEEKEKLETLKKEKIQIIEISENKVKSIKTQLDKNKKNKKYFSVVVDFAKLLTQKYISKSIKIIQNQIKEKNQESVLFQWMHTPDDFFNEQQSELINKIDALNEIKTDPYYSGAYGERLALKELSKLNDDYNILCGVNIELDKWHSFHGNKIKNAQIDFLVVSNKGVSIIEVKNWSDRYQNNDYGLSPQEQLERANRILYIFLKEELGDYITISGKLNNILLPIKNNIQYDPYYKRILVSSLDNINNLITNKRDVLMESEVERLVYVLGVCVTI